MKIKKEKKWLKAINIELIVLNNKQVWPGVTNGGVKLRLNEIFNKLCVGNHMCAHCVCLLGIVFPDFLSFSNLLQHKATGQSKEGARKGVGIK